MRRPILILVLICVFVCSVSAARRRRPKSKKPAYVRFQLLQHQPCPFRKGKSNWRRGMEFPKDVKSPLKRGSRKGCYKFGGELEVFKKKRKGTPLQMYVEIKDKPRSKKAPEQCYDIGRDGCGGVGSCVYCDACNVQIAGDMLGDKGKVNKNMIRKRFRKPKKRELNCKKAFKVGKQKEIYVEFCFPTLKRFFESKQLNPDVWEDIVEGGKQLKKIGLYMKVRFYNRKVNKSFKHAQIFEDLFRKAQRKNKDEALPMRKLMGIPFYKRMQQLMIGCHIIQGNLFLQKV